jgi:predicted MFS family arabinose efflux permease
MLFRLVLGLAIGAIIPASVVALLPWTPPPERGWAQGLLQAGLAAGGILAGPIVLVAEAAGSWRSAFPLFGALGAAWVLAWFFWFEARPNAGDAEPARLPIYWRGALRTMALPLSLAFAQGWGMELCSRWLPPFLVSHWHFDIKLSSTVAVLTVVAPILGSLAGGLAADLSIRHSGNIRSAHQLTPGLGFGLAALSLLLLPIGENETAIAIWLALALFGLQAAGVLLWVIAMDVGGPHPDVAAAFIGFGMLAARLLSPGHLVALTGFGQLPLFLGIPILLAGGVFSFRLRPHVELPQRPAGPPEARAEEESGAAA